MESKKGNTYIFKYSKKELCGEEILGYTKREEIQGSKLFLNSNINACGLCDFNLKICANIK